MSDQSNGILSNAEADLMGEHIVLLMRNGSEEQAKRALCEHTKAVFREGYHRHLNEMAREEADRCRAYLGHPATDPSNVVPALNSARL